MRKTLKRPLDRPGVRGHRFAIETEAVDWPKLIDEGTDPGRHHAGVSNQTLPVLAVLILPIPLGMFRHRR